MLIVGLTAMATNKTCRNQPKEGGNSLKYMGVEEVKQVLQIKDSKAYAVIRKLNAELAQKGYLTVRGKVPEKYLLERFYF